MPDPKPGDGIPKIVIFTTGPGKLTTPTPKVEIKKKGG